MYLGVAALAAALQGVACEVFEGLTGGVVREHRERVQGGGAEPAGHLVRLLGDVALPDGLHGLGQQLPTGPFEVLLDGVVVRAALHQQKRGQGERALHQVAADGLAHLRLVAGEVQDVVDDLERHTEVVAVAAQRLDPLLRLAGDDAAALAGGGEQGGVLAADALEVVANGLAAVVGGEVLVDLAPGHHHQRLREETDDADVAGAGDLVSGVGEHVVAKHDGGRVVEGAVGRGGGGAGGGGGGRPRGGGGRGGGGRGGGACRRRRGPSAASPPAGRSPPA